MCIICLPTCQLLLLKARSILKLLSYRKKDGALCTSVESGLDDKTFRKKNQKKTKLIKVDNYSAWKKNQLASLPGFNERILVAVFLDYYRLLIMFFISSSVKESEVSIASKCIKSSMNLTLKINFMKNRIKSYFC